MSYRLKQTKSSPIAMWLLDDTSPFQEHSGSGYTATLSGSPTLAAPLVAGAGWSTVFTNTFTGVFNPPVFRRGQERKNFALGAWVLPIVEGKQGILTHPGYFDGLWIENKVVHFTTKYAASGEATCSYDLGTTRAFYVVGIHTEKQNQLWVDGVLVDSVDITPEQLNDVYGSTDTALFCGASSTASAIAVNSIEVYNLITPENIVANYRAGRDVVPQSSVPSQFNGTTFSLSEETGASYIDRTWVRYDDFIGGYANNVNIELEQVSPRLDANNLSLSGSWSTAVFLDVAGVTSAYGVMVEWSGKNVTIEGSLDGTTWTALTSGSLVSMIPNGYTTTGKSFQVRATFGAGLAYDAAYLESLRIVGFKNNTITSTDSRAITVSYPGVVRKDYEPIEYRHDNGVSLNGGTLTIGPDLSEDPNTARTLELWIKQTGPTLTSNLTGTRYKNGVATATPLVQGEWALLQFTSATDYAFPITISGDCVIGQFSIYPTTLTASEIAHVYKSYTGKPVISIVDTSAIAIAETFLPVALYVRDWSIDGAGG